VATWTVPPWSPPYSSWTLETTGVIGSDLCWSSGAISGETGFPTGKYAMYMDGPWATNTYKQGELHWLRHGANSSGPADRFRVVGGEDLVIAKGGKNEAATIKFVKFLSLRSLSWPWLARVT